MLAVLYRVLYMNVLNCLNTVQHAGLYVMAASKISGWRWKEFGVKDRTHLCVAWDMGSAWREVGGAQSKRESRSSWEEWPPCLPFSEPAPEEGGVAKSPGPSRNDSRSVGSMLFSCKTEDYGLFWRMLFTHPTPISWALPDDGSRVKVKVVQREVAFDIIGKVFVFLHTECEDVIEVEEVFLPYLLSPLRGLLCPVPGVLGVAGRPGVWGVQGVWGPSPSPDLSRLFTASDIWESGPSSRGYWPDTMLFMSGGA